MSYILEALRRAERERDTGKAPSVESLNRVAVEIERTRVPLSVWMLAIGTALIACAALTVLLWPHSPSDVGIARVAETAPVAQPVPAPLRDPAPAEQADAEAPAATPTAIEDHDDVVSLDDVTGDAADASTSVDSSNVTSSSAAVLEPEDTAAELPTTDVAPTISAPESSTLDTAHGTIVVPAGVTVLREMPASYREQFPVHALDVHVYNTDPAKRWVMIAGKRYREGETVASGPQIAQIIEAGVVFDYRGAKVLLPVR